MFFSLSHFLSVLGGVRQLPKWAANSHAAETLFSDKHQLQWESGAWARSLLVRRLQTPAVGSHAPGKSQNHCHHLLPTALPLLPFPGKP